MGACLCSLHSVGACLCGMHFVGACLQAIGRKTIASRLAPTNPSLAISPVIARPRPPPTSSRGRRPWRSMTLCLHGLPRFARNDSQRREMLCILELACKRLAGKPSPAGWLPLAPQLARKKTRPASEHRSRSAGCQPCRSRCSPNYWRGRACSPSGRHPQHRGAAQSLIFASKDLLLTSPKTSDSAATTRRAS